MPDDFGNSRQLITIRPAEGFQVPALVADVGPEATKRFFEFFSVPIRNKNTRIAYYHAISQFLDWCQRCGLTLILADSFGRCLTAFRIAADGSLVNRRIWAALDGYPDGICIDSENMVWYADVPNQRCVRVREGGEVLQTVNLDRGCFACMLGGSDNRTLFLVANEWRGVENIAAVAQEKTGQVLAVEAPAVHAGRP